MTPASGPTAEDVGGRSADPSSGLTDAQQRIVVDNMPLVHHIVRRLTERMPASHQRDDLIQAGSLGLIEAARRFDPARGHAFSTFAGRRIEGAILDTIRRADWASRSVRRAERQLLKVDGDLQATLGRRPTADELSASMDMGVDELHGLRADVARARLDSLDRMAGEDAGRPPTGPVGADDHGGRIERAETMDALRRAVTALPERHRLVIVGHFLEGRSMTDLGPMLGVTQSRVSQIKVEALAMMRNGLQEALAPDDPTGPTGPTGSTTPPRTLPTTPPTPDQGPDPDRDDPGRTAAGGRREDGSTDAGRAAATWRNRIEDRRPGKDLRVL